MENKLPLKRLLQASEITPLLEEFAPLLGLEVSLAVTDAPDHLLASIGHFPLEVAQSLWEAAMEATKQAKVITTDRGVAGSIQMKGHQAGLVMAAGRLGQPARTKAALKALTYAIESLAKVYLERRALARETLDRYREVNLLYSLGETLATCLDVSELLQRVLAEASQIIHALRGAVLLYDETEELVTAASTGMPKDLKSAFTEGYNLAREVARTGRPQIVNEHGLPTPLLATPLLASERRLGAILLAGKTDNSIFTAGDEKLLSAIAWQAAISLENARLFDDVRQQRDQIATMMSYMDNIFASIASGVITTDTEDIIVTFNRAAEKILRIPASKAIQRPYRQVLDFLRYTPLPSLIEQVRQRLATYTTQEISSRLPQGDPIHLNLNLSTLLDSGGEILGVAIVMDDVTEKRRYEHERALIRTYLPAGLVDHLPYDMAEVGLRQERRVITTLFADIRGFTSFSEMNPPERVMEVLNNYLTLAEAAVRFNWGIVDKYLGDAVMALFNTPLLEHKDHAWQAVQMAWTLKDAIEAYHQYIGPEEQLRLGFGICTGVVVVGNVGTEDRMEYTAVGDTVNLAKRLQENAQPAQILISHETWAMGRNRIKVNPLPAIRVKGRQAFTRVYEVTGLIDDDD
jgi:adenylate cyclase